MTHKDFEKLVEYVIKERIKGVMRSKSAEYSRGDDKLHNFKRAAEVSGKTPLECLQGMKLKHDVSILDMLNDEATKYGTHSQEKWEEKISDDINYLILMLALLYDKYNWAIPGTKEKTDVDPCGTCGYPNPPYLGYQDEERPETSGHEPIPQQCVEDIFIPTCRNCGAKMVRTLSVNGQPSPWVCSICTRKEDNED